MARAGSARHHTRYTIRRAHHRAPTADIHSEVLQVEYSYPLDRDHRIHRLPIFAEQNPFAEGVSSYLPKAKVTNNLRFFIIYLEIPPKMCTFAAEKACI